MNNRISKYLDFFRKSKAISDFKVSLITINIMILITIIIEIIIESIFYLEIPNRQTIFNLTILFYLVGISYSCLKFYFNYKNLFNNSSNESIAHLIGYKFEYIKDQLINAYQLEYNLNKNNQVEYELSNHAIEQIKNKISNLALSFNDKKIHLLLRNLYLVISILVISLITFNNSLPSAFIRLINPNKQFDVPYPFRLINITEQDTILNGDNQKISIAVIGEAPDSINLNYIINDNQYVQKISHRKEIFEFIFNDIQTDIVWWTNIYSKSFFSSWDKVESAIDTIKIVRRPMISKLDFKIDPPSYTKLNSYIHPASMTNIKYPFGSIVYIDGIADKPLKSALLTFNENKYEFEVDNQNFSKKIQLFSTMEGQISCIDKNQNQNYSPIFYNFNVIPDMKPTLSIISPEHEFELDESGLINLDIQISDDYGISELWVEYQIKAPSYLGYEDSTIYKYPIIDINYDAKIQNVNHVWGINNIKISPDDEIHFTVNLKDNNPFDSIVVSSDILIGSYPSLEDLFDEIGSYEQDISEYNEDITDNIEQVQNLIDELKLDLLKSDQLDWKEKQEIDNAMEQMEDIFNQIDQVQDVIEKLEEKAEKNNLFNDDLMQKYDQFQNMLSEIISPELLDLMDKMKEMSNEMDIAQLLDELNDFEYNLEVFEEELDRFIDMFEQAMAEKKLDEIIQKLEEAINNQIEIMDELNDGESNFNDLSSKQRVVEEDYKNIQDVIKDAQQATETISKSTADMLSSLKSSELNKQTGEDLSNARKSLQKKQESQSKENVESAKSNLSDMLENIKNIQKSFQQETINDMMNAFFDVVNSVINISQNQDDLIELSSGLRSNSPLLPNIASQQNRIKLKNEQLMQKILLLSRQTFYINPPMIRALGKSTLAIDKSIGYLEQKRSSQAFKEQKNIINGFNETGYLLLSSMEEMMSSGSASGLESFMDQIGELSDGQQSLNQSTMQLPQMGMGSGSNIMEQLMQQQQALKQGLEQLLNQMGGENSNQGLGQAIKDMEDVINDFKRNQVDRETKDRQQKILSRMLDSQKSLTQKDFSNKRKSEQYFGNNLYLSPDGLPEDKGQRDLLLINAMDDALKENHSNEYKEAIKLYFYNLQKNKSE